MQSGSVNGALEIDRSSQRCCDPPLYLKQRNKGLCSLKTKNIKIYHSGPSAGDKFKQREQSPSDWICRLGPYRVQCLRPAQVFGSTQPPPGQLPSLRSPEPSLTAVGTQSPDHHDRSWAWLCLPMPGMEDASAGPEISGSNEGHKASPPGGPGQASLQEPSSRGSCTAHHLGCQLCQPARSIAKPSLAAGVQEEESPEPGL